MSAATRQVMRVSRFNEACNWIAPSYIAFNKFKFYIFLHTAFLSHCLISPRWKFSKFAQMQNFWSHVYINTKARC